MVEIEVGIVIETLAKQDRSSGRNRIQTVAEIVVGIAVDSGQKQW